MFQQLHGKAQATCRLVLKMFQKAAAAGSCMVGLLFITAASRAQLPVVDTVTIKLADAEQQFLAKNLELLAQKYNVDATKALIMQAKLYPNPNFNITQGAYNPQTGRWFQTNGQGEEAYQLTQLVVLSRKIHKQVNMAETNYKLAEDNLYDLLRTLKYALRSTYFNIYYLQKTERVYDEEINALKKVVAAYKEVQGKGYVAESEIVQVQAQLYALQSEYQTLADNINDQESQLRLVLQAAPNVYFKPTVDTLIEHADPLTYSYAALIDSAYANRTDMAIAKDSLLLSQQYYSYQRALAVPDISLGASYDRQGSYVNDFNAVTLGFDIPIFNRNQGNIKNARKLVDYSSTQLQLTQKTLEEQVSRGMQKAVDADKLYRGIDPNFASGFERLAKAMVTEYMHRNVSLLTFQSFYDSYKQHVVQLNTILYNKVNALENLNLLTGTNFFNK
jgi:outer membrane protein, heavy metal efflux system